MDKFYESMSVQCNGYSI